MRGYVLIASDPPWRYKDKLRMTKVKRSAGDHYRTLSVDQICRMVPRAATPAILCLWVTNAMLLDGSGVRVCQAYGFEPKQLVTWIKGRLTAKGLVLQIGMGQATRNCTEHFILATRGRYRQLIKRRNLPNVIIAPLQRHVDGRKHSTKPDAAFALMEALVRATPSQRLEMFARRPRRGWRVMGNEARGRKDGRTWRKQNTGRNARRTAPKSRRR